MTSMSVEGKILITVSENLINAADEYGDLPYDITLE
jgi:hypothetical protein